MLYTSPRRDLILPSYVEAHRLNKGRGRPLLDEGEPLLSFSSIGSASDAIVYGSLVWLQLHITSLAIPSPRARFDYNTVTLLFKGTHIAHHNPI